MPQRQRTRPELADFLKYKRESIRPEMVGLNQTKRRRTPGLRREEVATLAGVGLTWYTWLEQGRDIGVSTQFLDQLAKTLQMNEAERRHLYLLTCMRSPLETGVTEQRVPESIQRIMDDFPADYLCYVLNLNWDVLAFNLRADQYFNFSKAPPYQCNFLWLLFSSTAVQVLFADWKLDASRLLASFRRDYALNKNNVQVQSMIEHLIQSSAEFNQMWHQHDIYPPCSGIRAFSINNSIEQFQYISLTFDQENHTRLIVYVPILGTSN